jgi:hypothetical protein
MIVGGTSPWWWKEFFSENDNQKSLTEQTDQKTQQDSGENRPEDQKYTYLVTEYNPFSKGVENQKVFSPQESAKYTQTCNAYKKIHWVKWRYAGINEPLRTLRFSSYRAAQGFIDNNGPAKKGLIPGIAFLSEPAKIVPAKVICNKKPA